MAVVVTASAALIAAAPLCHPDAFVFKSEHGEEDCWVKKQA